MIENVAVLAPDYVESFGLGVFCEVWGDEEHPEDGTPAFDFAVCGRRPGPVRGSGGFDISVQHGIERLAEADLVAVAPTSRAELVSHDVLEELRAVHRRGAIVMTHCTGAYVLGRAGLLSGRRCTTHWRHARHLAEMFPDALVDPDVLYVEDDRVLTGAGSAAGIDACLHVVREHIGAKVAGAFARRIVVPPHRDGGQAQFIRTPVPEYDADTLSPLLDWIREHLDQSLRVETLAERAMMSPRTFARRFRDETGTTPHQWITQQRVANAEELLEETDLSVDEIATRSGFGNAAQLRHHFSAMRGTTPQAYRRRFGYMEVG